MRAACGDPGTQGGRATMTGQLEGRHVPDATFHVLEHGKVGELHAHALFALRGAFTPTCPR